MLTPDDILKLVRQQPFRPFRIHLSDGASYEIRHPELAVVFPRRVEIMVPSPRKPGLMEDSHHCAIMHITRLEELADAG